MSTLPIDFEKKMKVLLGEEYESFIEGYENDKYQALRLNPLKKTTRSASDVFDKLVAASDKDTDMNGVASGEICSVPWEENGYYYDGALRPGKHAYHEAGVYYIQEPSAMSAAALLAPKPGMKVLDLCAAPGGKSTQLAGYLMQEGLLIANEIHPARCKILSQNIERMGIRNAIVTNEDSKKLADYFPCYFDAILVDAPCSGEGMFRKTPEAMEEWSLQNVALCATRQEEILDNAASMLKGGGRLVYSTCTFSPEENEMTIVSFLERHPEFEVLQVEAPWFEKGRPEWVENQAANTFVMEAEKTLRLWPHRLHGEGHYVAVLKKAGELSFTEQTAAIDKDLEDKENKSKKGKQKAVLDNILQKALEEFLEESVTQELAKWILSGTLTLFGDQLYRLPEEAPSLRGLRVLRAGLHIGEFKKNRFEPSHALALSLGADEVLCAIALKAGGENRIPAYYRGETISISEQELCKENTKNKGWALVCVDGFSAGWGKLSNGQLKNHYPKGLRREVMN